MKKNIFSNLFLIFCLLSLVSNISHAKTLFIDVNKSTGKVDFKAVGKPSLLSIHGKGKAPKGVLKIVNRKVSGVISFQLKTLKTGLKLRNRHMKRKFLEIKKYPKTTLTITSMRLPKEFDQENATINNVPFTGTLYLHGVKKQISATANIVKMPTQVQASSSFSLNMKEYNIKTPSYAGIRVMDDITIIVEFSAPLIIGSSK